MRASTVFIKTEQDIEKLQISGRFSGTSSGNDWSLYKGWCFN